MLLRNLRTVWLALLIILVAGVSVVPPARADMGRPVWTVGDYWEYNVTHGYAGIAAGDGILYQQVDASETVRVDGIDYPSYRVHTTVDVTKAPPAPSSTSLSGNSWYRTSDLSLVKSSLRGMWTTPVNSYVLTVALTWSPPRPIQWPLAGASTWTSSGWLNMTLDYTVIQFISNQTDRTTYTVEPEGSVTVPAGTFLTTPLNGTASPRGYNTSYWSRDAGNVVLQIGVDRWGQEVERLELTSYRYQVASDTTPPTITGVTAAPSPQAAGRSLWINATIADDLQVAGAWVNVTQPGGATLNRSMTRGAGNGWSYSQAWTLVGVHNFVVWASDTAGHWASGSGTFTIRLPDTERPRIAHTPPAGTFYPGMSITVNATVTDDDRVQEVRIHVSNVTGVERNVTMPLASGSTYTVTIPAQTVPGTVWYRIYAVDASGNTNITDQYYVTIRTPPPPPGPILDTANLVGIGIVLVIVVLAAAFVVMRRRKKAAPPAEPPGALPPSGPPPSP